MSFDTLYLFLYLGFIYPTLRNLVSFLFCIPDFSERIFYLENCFIFIYDYSWLFSILVFFWLSFLLCVCFGFIRSNLFWELPLTLPSPSERGNLCSGFLYQFLVFMFLCLFVCLFCSSVLVLFCFVLVLFAFDDVIPIVLICTLAPLTRRESPLRSVVFSTFVVILVNVYFWFVLTKLR